MDVLPDDPGACPHADGAMGRLLVSMAGDMG
jgi:hypothetical protein